MKKTFWTNAEGFSIIDLLAILYSGTFLTIIVVNLLQPNVKLTDLAETMMPTVMVILSGYFTGQALQQFNLTSSRRYRDEAILQQAKDDITEYKKPLITEDEVKTNNDISEEPKAVKVTYDVFESDMDKNNKIPLEDMTNVSSNEVSNDIGTSKAFVDFVNNKIEKEAIDKNENKKSIIEDIAESKKLNIVTDDMLNKKDNDISLTVVRANTATYKIPEGFEDEERSSGVGNISTDFETLNETQYSKLL